MAFQLNLEPDNTVAFASAPGRSRKNETEGAAAYRAVGNGEVMKPGRNYDQSIWCESGGEFRGTCGMATPNLYKQGNSRRIATGNGDSTARR
jgi:hypothetical protein